MQIHDEIWQLIRDIVLLFAGSILTLPVKLIEEMIRERKNKKDLLTIEKRKTIESAIKFCSVISEGIKDREPIRHRRRDIFLIHSELMRINNKLANLFHLINVVYDGYHWGPMTSDKSVKIRSEKNLNKLINDFMSELNSVRDSL